MSEFPNIEIRYLYKYPWLPGGRQMFESEPEINENSAETDEFHTIYKTIVRYFIKYKELPVRLNQIFKYALDKRESGFTPSDDKSNIILYYLIKLILAALNNKFLDNHMANFLSKIYYDRIKRENPRVMVKLSQYMDLDVQLLPKPQLIDNVQYPYTIHYSSYIPIASLLKDDSWNIINRYLDNGKIYLLPTNLARLLQEKIRREVIPERIGLMDVLLENLKKIDVLNSLFNHIEETLDLIKIKERKYKQNSDYISGDIEKPEYDLYPPCIKFILDKALDGVNLTHNERLHIAFFFANTEHSVEETVDVFRTLPDFSEEIARYNVEFSRGINGKGKKYSVFGCPKLKSLGICKADDKKFGESICEKGVKKKGETSYNPIKSPLSFIFWKKVEINRKKWEEINKQNEQNEGGEKTDG